MKNKKELIDIDPVQLKPIFGIRPGIVISIGLLVAILLLLFLLFLLPGILSDKAYVSFSFNSTGVAIYDGERYIGSSEGSVYALQSGSHNFKFYLNGVECGEIDAKLKKHRFFTLFVHRVQNIDYEIQYSSKIEDAVIEGFIKDVSEYSRVTDYSSTYHYPPLFKSVAYNAVNLGFSSIEDAWLYGALHITSDTMYKDYLEGKAILENSAVQYSSHTLSALEEKLYLIFEENNGKSIAKMERKDVLFEKSGSFFLYPKQSNYMGTSSSLSYPDIITAGVEIETDSFYIASTAVSEYEYALFVEANPFWAKSNMEALIEKGLVDENYLNGIILTTSLPSTRPIRNISFNAAKAYTEWLSSKEGIAYSLPSEKEWTVAAYSSSGKEYTKSLIGIERDPSSPSFMMGQLWEMTSTPFVPLSRISSYDDAIELSEKYSFDDIIIKGGSYINADDNITQDSVGVIDRASCSEYVGFRLAYHE